MAQTGYTPILIYSSSTASQAPAAGNLTNSTLGSELAINITDGKLFYKDNANAVQVIAWKTTPTTAGGTGLTSYTAGDLLYYASGTAFTKLAIGATGRWLGSSGTAPQWNAPAALTKTDDTNVTLTLGGSASTALLNAASLTLGWKGQLAVGRGGTGLSSYTVNGVLYASGATTLANGSGFTTDGVNVSQIGTSPLLRLQDSASSNNSRLLLQAQSGAVYISTTYSSSNIPMIFSFGGTSTGTEVFRITTAGKLNVTGLTASKVVFTDASKDLTSTGTVGADQGGTGQSSYTTGDLLYATGATALSKLGIGASTTILTSSGTAPQWSSASGLSVGTATNLAGGSAGSLPYQTGAGATTMLGIGASGRWLGSSGTAPQWNSPAALTKTDDTNVTLTLGGSASTALLNAASLTVGWTGTLAVSRGGTGTGTAGITAFNNITGYTASGATGTTSTNLVFSTSPSITTPTLVGDATFSTGNLIQGTAAKGINFTANSAASGMTSQLLNWYEEGTWTPALNFGGASTGITYTSQAGTYTRIGRQVRVSCKIALSSKGSATGYATLTGLPYSSGANSWSNNIIDTISAMANLTAGGAIFGSLAASDNTIYMLVYGTVNRTTVDNTYFQNTSIFSLDLTYTV